MTEDTEPTHDTPPVTDRPESTATSSTSQDDARFEVKWRKKETSSSSVDAAEGTLTSTADDIVELRRKLEEAEKRAGELQDRWHRAAADLANLRKRNEAERTDLEKFASMMMVAEMLPVLDNFEQAFATIPRNLAMLTWVEGVMLIDRRLRSILEAQGLAAIEADGQLFNPHQHHAIAEQETDKVPPGHVSQVYQKGYTMHGRVIRPALVEVAKAPVTAEKSRDEPAPSSADDSGTEIADNAREENAGP